MQIRVKIDDPIHGQIELPGIIAAIEQTMYFQRLKRIRQLNTRCHSHSRYDHCIGTYYLASRFLEQLEENTDELHIPEFYKTCVCVAGLLHDVGHGPFSHFWENITNICHETNAWSCIDKIFASITLTLSNNPAEHDYGIKLIKSLITGEKEKLAPPIDEDKEFLFEIVNNKYAGIDIDKWDYLQRDTHYLEGRTETTLDELFYTAKVSDNRKHIEYKSGRDVANLFKVRETMHIKHYQKPMDKALSEYLKRAILVAIENGCRFGSKLLSEVTSFDSEFLNLNDENVIKTLKEMGDPDICFLLEVYENEKLRECREEDRYDLFKEIRVPYAGEFIKMNGFQFQIYGEDKQVNATKYGYNVKKYYYVINDSTSV